MNTYIFRLVIFTNIKHKIPCIWCSGPLSPNGVQMGCPSKVFFSSLHALRLDKASSSTDFKMKKGSSFYFEANNLMISIFNHSIGRLFRVLMMRPATDEFHNRKLCMIFTFSSGGKSLEVGGSRLPLNEKGIDSRSIHLIHRYLLFPTNELRLLQDHFQRLSTCGGNEIWLTQGNIGFVCASWFAI